MLFFLRTHVSRALFAGLPEHTIAVDGSGRSG
jgi:hypothetical protein